MSADNYFLIRKHEGRYVVTMEFASDDQPYGPGPAPVEEALKRGRGYTRVFDTLDAADDYAHSEYSEYGVEYGFPTRTTIEEVEV